VSSCHRLLAVGKRSYKVIDFSWILTLFYYVSFHLTGSIHFPEASYISCFKKALEIKYYVNVCSSQNGEFYSFTLENLLTTSQNISAMIVIIFQLYSITLTFHILTQQFDHFRSHKSVFFFLLIFLSFSYWNCFSITNRTWWQLWRANPITVKLILPLFGILLPYTSALLISLHQARK
jgi:hypothetical protein